MQRDNGRKFDELRRIDVKRNYIKHALGSCLIGLGNTSVICTASIEKNVPLFLRNSGEGWLTAEYRMIPCAAQGRIPRDKISGRTIEIQRLIGRSLRSVVDLKKIGEKTIRIDCDVIQANGGTRTTSIVGGFIALVDCLHRLYKRNDLKEVYITDYLGATSVGILGNEHMLDLTYEEDSQADVDMNIVMNGSGKFIEVQGAAEKGSFSEKDLNSLLDLAKKGINNVIEFEKNIFQDILFHL